MAAGKFDRWLRDAEPWIQDEDWTPDEYFKWVKRLASAKAQLDETFTRVDQALIEGTAQLARSHKDSIMKKRKTEAGFYPDTAAKMIVRYIIAYNFFVRGTFEEVPEKSLVKRAQVHFVGLGIAINDVEIAQMLQLAADKVRVPPVSVQA
jgi:hypothetical protein